MLKTVLVQDAALEPVTVSEVKNHLRVTEDLEDILIHAFIVSARKTVEQVTRRALINQTWRIYFDAFPNSDEIELPYPPLVEISSIKYYDADGVLQTLDPSVYQTDNRSTPGKIVLSSGGAWPTVESDKVNAVEVEFIAGYGASASAVPMPVRLAVIHLVSHWFENREPYRDSAFEMRETPYTLNLLLMPYRFLRLR